MSVALAHEQKNTPDILKGGDMLSKVHKSRCHEIVFILPFKDHPSHRRHA